MRNWPTFPLAQDQPRPPRIIRIQRANAKTWEVQVEEPASGRRTTFHAHDVQQAYRLACLQLGFPQITNTYQGLAALLELPQSVNLAAEQWPLPAHFTVTDVVDRLGLNRSTEGEIELLTTPDGRSFHFGVDHFNIDEFAPEIMDTSHERFYVIGLT